MKNLIQVYTLFILSSHAIASSELVLIPEQETPPGILFENLARRRSLSQLEENQIALEHFKNKIEQSWSEIQKTNIEALSRFQIDATRGYQLPQECKLGEGRIIGQSAEKEILFLEIFGPRLPAKYDIIYRYITFYSDYNIKTRQLGPVIITIRGWILE